jgi:hypothetical protein
MLGYIDYLFFRLRHWLKRGRNPIQYEIEIRRLYNERVGLKKFERDELYEVMSYKTNGKFDYELYKKIQTLGNKGKIDRVFAQEENIRYLIGKLERINPNISFVLCHGTRNAAEQNYFQKYLAKPATVLGTEISDNAHEYPMTIEWDFHETKPEWIEKTDVVYSNSWDHSYDPEKLFRAWLSCLSVNGVMALEWSQQHDSSPKLLDPLSISVDNLLKLLRRLDDGGRYKVLEPDTDLPVRDVRQTFVLVQRVS